MDAYPEAFLSHLQPCLHVAGLGKAAGATETDQEQDELALLRKDLRTALSARSNVYDVWDASRGTSAESYNVVLVDSEARFPPRKAKTGGGSPAHSPISPLTLSSPLHPDGIIAPIWVRKHRELLPCAFLLVATLWAPAEVTVKSPLDVGQDQDSSQQAEIERKKDLEMISIILERKRLTNERGIKLAVVLLASKQLLESATLDYRLSIIRRQSGLDARASLFVISPVPFNDVQSFVTSLKNELFESIVDYYREHGRRVRRKKSRVPSAIGSRQVAINGAANSTVATAQPLSAQGWSVRYDYKLAVFAEMRQEFDVALKHYEDCYNALLDLFGSPSSLPPRTKRWAEAKVLADCVSVKICKFYMYNDEPNKVMAQHNRHLYKFRVLCETWQIGMETYEFWSWSTKQYRLLAELVDVAIRGGFRLTAPKTLTTMKAPNNPQAQILATGTNPSTALQHPGHYYHLAALCAMQRRDLFRAAEEKDASDQSPAFAHEKTVNHTDQVLQLLTKAYELFKRYRATRMGLLVAYQIATTHIQSNNHAMALRFFERIAKSYRREHWRKLFTAVLEETYLSGQLTNAPSSAFAAGFELLSPFAAVTLSDRSKIAATLFSDLAAKPPSEAQSRILRIEPHAGFIARDQAPVGTSLEYELEIQALDCPLGHLAFDSLRVILGDNQGEILLLHQDSTSSTRDIMLSQTEISENNNQHASCSLIWQRNERRTIKGTLNSKIPLTAEIKNIIAFKQVGDWAVEMLLEFSKVSNVPLQNSKSTVSSSGGLACRFVPRPLNISLSIAFQNGLLDAQHECKIILTNNESETLTGLELTISLASQKDSTDEIISGETRHPNLITIKLGQIGPGETLSLPFKLIARGNSGPRRINVSGKLANSNSNSGPATTVFAETATATANFEPAFVCVCKPIFKRKRQIHRKGNATENTLPDPWSLASRAEIEICLSKESDLPICIDGMTIKHEDPNRSRTVAQSWHGALPADLGPEQDMDFFASIDILGSDAFSPGILQFTWRQSSDTQSTIGEVRLPSLTPPFPSPCVFAKYPPMAQTHQLVTFAYAVQNPSQNTLTVSVAVESAESWVLAGPRTLARIDVRPFSEHTIYVKAMAISRVGLTEIPRVKVFEILPTFDEIADDTEDGDGSMAAQPRTRLLSIFSEGSTVDLAEEEAEPLRIHILP